MGAYERSLTRKQRFFIIFFELLPNIELIHELWELYRKEEDRTTLAYHESVSPFRPHPCGDGCIINKIVGIDFDMLMMYMKPRKCWLAGLKMVGHPSFICKFTRKKEDIENCEHYFDALLREEQVKLLPLQKVLDY